MPELTGEQRIEAARIALEHAGPDPDLVAVGLEGVRRTFPEITDEDVETARRRLNVHARFGEGRD